MDYDATCTAALACSWQYDCVAVDRSTGALDANYWLSTVTVEEGSEGTAALNSTHGRCSCSDYFMGTVADPSPGCPIASAWALALSGLEIALGWPAIGYLLCRFTRLWYSYAWAARSADTAIHNVARHGGHSRGAIAGKAKINDVMTS